MRKILYLFLILVFSANLKSQDFLSAPSSNPILFDTSEFGKLNDKLLVAEDTLVYQYDTLILPFIDDFSTNHLPERASSISDPLIKDTLFYQIYINGIPYTNPEGFSADTTGYFTLNSNDSIVNAVPNPKITIELFDLSNYPPRSELLEVYPPYNIYDTIGGLVDTLFTTPDFEADSARFYFLPPNGNDFYTNRSVYWNTTFPINPPSIGVVTFDGLDEFGIPYDIDNPRRVRADELSSVPIDLANTSDNEIYFSFFYQPKGLSIDSPEPEDSLVLDFFNANTQKWQNVWRVPGFASDSFLYEIIRVPDSLQLNGFRFRFRNYASSAGGFDQWHLDYIYMNDARSINDTARIDIAHVYDAPSLLNDYTAMPWFHFRTNPQQYMTDTVKTLVVNSSPISLSVYNKMVILDTVPDPDTVYYRYPAGDNFVFLPSKTQFNFTYEINFEYSMNDVNSAGTFDATYDIDFRPGMGQPQDFIRSNDTIIGKTVLEDYYAYDDGTAEAGYGINPNGGQSSLNAFMAVEFNIPFPDTIGGLGIYFLPQGQDIRNQTLELTVWNSLSPPNVIFTMPVRYNPQYTDVNGYLTYFFDSLVVVNQTFYVGFQSIGEYSLNVGYDLNRNNRDKIFWSFDGLNWNFPSNGILDGSLMMRPVFRRTAIGVGLNDASLDQELVKVYPNPTKGTIFIEQSNANVIKEIVLLDIHGKLILQQGFQNRLELDQLPPGLYFLSLTTIENQFITKKIIVSP